MLIVQRTVALVPGAIPVTVVFATNGLVIVAVPKIKLQEPVPGEAALAAIVKILLLHCSIFTPASAIGAGAKFVIVTSSNVGAQTTPLLIVQRNTALLPAVNPVTPLVFEVGVVILAPFAGPMIVQSPLPGAAALPASVKEPLLQFSWSAPAAATGAGAVFVKIISD